MRSDSQSTSGAFWSGPATADAESALAVLELEQQDRIAVWNSERGFGDDVDQ